ncbi:hypothetical protein [Thermoplasma sp. Kam2015]|uniref:hypothetical protein n=1 Tax=Thermoplasma sp. Kam2015 TaxID=2094122 RepID=UPI001F3D747B|nr:hypothetical protein [Thermoplasma sp. Kam2015]
MFFVATIGKAHEKIEGYSYNAMLRYILSMNPSRIYVTYLTHYDYDHGLYGEEIKKLMSEDLLADKVSFRGVDEKKYRDLYQKYVEENRSSPEFVIKFNVLDIMNTTLNSYLEGYWKDPGTVNSEVTDSLFRAKHKLTYAMFPDLEVLTWENKHREIMENIEMTGVTPNTMILCPAESRYWFIDHFSTHK